MLYKTCNNIYMYICVCVLCRKNMNMAFTHMETTCSSITVLIMIRDSYLCLVSLKIQVKYIWHAQISASVTVPRLGEGKRRKDKTQGLKMDVSTRCSTMRRLYEWKSNTGTCCLQIACGEPRTLQEKIIEIVPDTSSTVFSGKSRGEEEPQSAGWSTEEQIGS